MTVLTGKNVGMQVADRWLYHNVDFELGESRLLALIGDNGVGKTTLLRAILGQRAVSEGTLTWGNGTQPAVQYVPQYRPDMQAFPLFMKDFIALSFDKVGLPWLRKTEREQLAHILMDTNLNDLAKRRIDTASGGERQRAYLAQALVRNPNVLILDEATANLDNVAKYELMDVVKHYRDHHDLSIIMVSHDLDIIKQYADDYLLLTSDGSEFGQVANLDYSKLKVGAQDHA
jgi:zinc/manganese transport system ATP-binding protein